MFEKGTELELRLDPNLQFIWGESHAIQQALVNIVLNAEKVVPEKGGVVRISTRQLEGEIEVVIEDNGPGIPEEIRETIFSPFFTTDVTKGTGLGLASAYGIVKNHGGYIDVYSEKGKGAEFNIYLHAIEGGAVAHREEDDEIGDSHADCGIPWRNNSTDSYP